MSKSEIEKNPLFVEWSKSWPEDWKPTPYEGVLKGFDAGYAAGWNDRDGKTPTYDELRAQLALVTAERDKAIERCAIFERAVEHYAAAQSWTDDADIGVMNVYAARSGNGYDIAVKAKQDAEEVG